MCGLSFKSLNLKVNPQGSEFAVVSVSCLFFLYPSISSLELTHLVFQPEPHSVLIQPLVSIGYTGGFEGVKHLTPLSLLSSPKFFSLYSGIQSLPLRTQAPLRHFREYCRERVETREAGSGPLPCCSKSSSPCIYSMYKTHEHYQIRISLSKDGGWETTIGFDH